MANLKNVKTIKNVAATYVFTRAPILHRDCFPELSKSFLMLQCKFVIFFCF